MNDLEREAIILNSAWEMIDGMVNWAVFVKTERTEPSNLMFQTSGHARLFVILLGDFLSEIRAFKGDPIPLGLNPAPSNARPSDLTFLFHLRQVCAGPKLGADAAGLSAAIEAFATWLEGESTPQASTCTRSMSSRTCASPVIATSRCAVTWPSITWRASRRT